MFRLLFGILAVLPTQAQETRRVAEPIFPPSFAVLKARVSKVDEAQPEKPDPDGHALGPRPVNLWPSGPDVRAQGRPDKGPPNACQDKFVALPN